jgi:uncharacterized protein
MTEQIVSDEYLNAFVDNQLDATERIRVFESIRQNESLKDRVCEITGLKEMMQYAYKAPPAHASNRPTRNRSMHTRFQALAACILLCLGGITGWMAHTWAGMSSGQELKNFVQNSLPNENISDFRRVIVHVSNSNPLIAKAALDETESLLESYKRNDRRIQVELIANKDGVNLFRADFSHQKKRISHLQEKYPNLKILVCGQTIGKLRSKGESIRLLPHVGIASSAAEQINMRLEEGWGYVRI